jgi:hypothetical protein
MSGTLDTSLLLGAINDEKEVNLPSDALEYSKKVEEQKTRVISRALRDQERTKEGSSSTKELEKVRAELLRLKEEKEELERKGLSKLGRKANPRAQEEKVLSAIKSEMIRQETSEPVVQKRLFRKEYKVHPTTLNSTIERLVQKGVIKETIVSYAGKVNTFKYLIL